MVRKPNRDIQRERKVTYRLHVIDGRWVGVFHAYFWGKYQWFHTIFSFASEDECRAVMKGVKRDLRRGHEGFFARFSGDLKDIRTRNYEVWRADIRRKEDAWIAQRRADRERGGA